MGTWREKYERRNSWQRVMSSWDLQVPWKRRGELKCQAGSGLWTSELELDGLFTSQWHHSWLPRVSWHEKWCHECVLSPTWWDFTLKCCVCVATKPESWERFRRSSVSLLRNTKTSCERSHKALISHVWCLCARSHLFVFKQLNSLLSSW